MNSPSLIEKNISDIYPKTMIRASFHIYDIITALQIDSLLCSTLGCCIIVQGAATALLPLFKCRQSTTGGQDFLTS
jgi:hypothetical protein